MPRQRYSIGYLTTDYKDIAVSADNAEIEIKWIWATNRSGSTASFELAHVPANAAAGETLDLIHDYSMDANDTLSLDSLVYMAPGDRIVAKASAGSAIVLTIYGMESYVSGSAGSSQIVKSQTPTNHGKRSNAQSTSMRRY
tara:strand:- start:1838 stop:2260 length:423 start_codon:yes stop_codon:yes gene_type:complete